METVTSNPKLEESLAKSAAMHRRLCPRQVLGIRMGMYAAEILSIEVPQADKRMLVFVEADGCFADGVSVATGCTLGHRTMRLMDHGKVAATFVDTETGRAIRLSPRADVRQRAMEVAPEAANRWRAQLEGYQKLANEELCAVLEVTLNLDLKALVGRPGVRVNCSACSEEILNGRELEKDGRVLCRSCAGKSYWRSAEDR